MKRIIYLICILTLFISCKKELNIQPKYSDFETDLEARNLFGKVKEFSQFKANIISSDKNQTEEPIISLIEEFTEYGSVKKITYFDTFGKTQQTRENFYDENDYLQKSITIGENFPQRMVELIKRDTINKTGTRNITINDTLKYEFKAKFGELKKIEKQIKIENGDTTVIDYNYKYDSNNNLIRLEETDKDNETINEYKYDEIGNVVEYIYGTDYFKVKTITEYKDNRIAKITTYNISADLKEHLENVIEYDKYYNPINKKIYQNSELDRELKNEYKFDNNGNWITKTVYLKENYANSNKFIPIYVENRKIKYWK